MNLEFTSGNFHVKCDLCEEELEAPLGDRLIDELKKHGWKHPIPRLPYDVCKGCVAAHTNDQIAIVLSNKVRGQILRALNAE